MIYQINALLLIILLSFYAGYFWQKTEEPDKPSPRFPWWWKQ